MSMQLNDKNYFKVSCHSKKHTEKNISLTLLTLPILGENNSTGENKLEITQPHLQVPTKVPCIHGMCRVQRRSRLCIRISCIPPWPYASHFVVLVLLNLLFCFYQDTPLDVAAEFRHDELVAYLQSAADPKMLRVSMWDCTIEDSCGVKWRSTHTNRHIIAAICFTCESSTHESSLNWPWWLRRTCLLLMHEVGGEELV